MAGTTSRVVCNSLVAAAAAGDGIVGVTVGEAQLLVDTALRVADWDMARIRDIVDAAGSAPTPHT